MKGRFSGSACKTFLLTIWMALFAAAALGGPGGKTPVAGNGVLDLKGMTLAAQALPWDGDGAFYWRQLVYPPHPPQGQPQYVPFPRLWNQMNLPSKGYATYYLTILLDKPTSHLAMDVPVCYTCYRLFLNGRFQCNSGSPDTTEEKAGPHWVNKTVNVPHGLDKIQLTLQIAN